MYWFHPIFHASKQHSISTLSLVNNCHRIRKYSISMQHVLDCLIYLYFFNDPPKVRRFIFQRCFRIQELKKKNLRKYIHTLDSVYQFFSSPLTLQRPSVFSIKVHMVRGGWYHAITDAIPIHPFTCNVNGRTENNNVRQREMKISLYIVEIRCISHFTFSSLYYINPINFVEDFISN